MSEALCLSNHNCETKSMNRRRPPYIPSRIPDSSFVRIFDTTLRDGEQSPGASFTTLEKIEIARELAKLGVDIIEAGFPAASKEDFEAVKMIAKEVGNHVVDKDGHVPVICVLSRCTENDIRTAWEAVKYAKRPRILTFIATSNIHLKYKLKKTKDQVIDIARNMVRFATTLGCHDVQFGLEDAARSDREFVYEFLGEVIKAGATTVGIADTVGYTMPEEFGKLISDIKANTAGIENVVISTHCHNDLGLATANTLAGACAGARQLEVTINGIGERAGNASLEEVVMALHCRGEHVLGGLYTRINPTHIFSTSKMVEKYTGLNVQPHKAIVGANAFSHESGIHQDGVLKHKGTYEIISPELIGYQRSNDAGIVLGKLSGRHALKTRLLELGYEVNKENLENLFWRFKAVGETKKRVTDADLRALVSEEEYFRPTVLWKLQDLQVMCGTLALSTATVKLVDGYGKEHIACAVGTGPITSAYKAVHLIVKEPATLVEYSMNSVTQGIDATATTRAVIRSGDNNAILAGISEAVQPTFTGIGKGMDIVVSSVEAYLSALNSMLGFNRVGTEIIGE